MIKRRVSHRLERLRPGNRHGGQRPLEEPGWVSDFIRMLVHEAARQAARQLKDWFQA